MRSRTVLLGIAGMTVLLLAALATGCGGTEEQDVTVLEGATWMLVAMRGADVGLQPVTAGVQTTAAFAGGTVGGNGGVNQYSGTYKASGDGQMTIELGPSTLMAGPEPAMTQEAQYFALLPKTQEFIVTAESLQLMDGAGVALMRFEPLAQTAFQDTEWSCTGYNNGKDAVVSLVPDSEITAQFLASGQLTGSAGVNMYNGTYKVIDDALQIGPLATTKMAGPEKLMQQESAYLTALAKVTRYRIDGAVLTLLGGADGDVTMATYTVK